MYFRYLKKKILFTAEGSGKILVILNMQEYMAHSKLK